jgi:hypothetical protein
MGSQRAAMNWVAFSVGLRRAPALYLNSTLVGLQPKILLTRARYKGAYLAYP